MLSEYYVNEGILINALRLRQRIYGDNAINDDVATMRGLQRMEKRIAERGTISSYVRVGNMKISLQATEDSMQSNHTVTKHLIESLTQLLLDKTIDTKALTESQKRN